MPLDLAALHQIGARVTAGVADEAHDSILLPSQQRIPVQTGRARASGRVVAEGLQVWVTFGKDDDGSPPSNTYIEVLEEDSEAKHADGQAHFLKSSADEAAAGFVERVAKRVSL